MPRCAPDDDKSEYSELKSNSPHGHNAGPRHRGPPRVASRRESTSLFFFESSPGRGIDRGMSARRGRGLLAVVYRLRFTATAGRAAGGGGGGRSAYAGRVAAGAGRVTPSKTNFCLLLTVACSPRGRAAGRDLDGSSGFSDSVHSTVHS